MRVGFLHPELGLGGAERLIVDAALELQGRGHEVTLYTASYDPSRAFPEAASLDVRVHGAFLPRQIAGRLTAPCAIARVSWAASALASARRFDAIVCDLVPYPLPALRLLGGGARIVYYCHFPDQLLARPSRGLYRLYRTPLDRLEVPAMRAAHKILVNSRYTAGVVARLGGTGEVLYPGIDVERYAGVPELSGEERTLAVIGRFDSRKNLPLALESLARLRAVAPGAFAQLELVLAGGLDPHRRADEELLRDLKARAQSLGLDNHVRFHASPSEADRMQLLERALCVVHTAPDEHFGLVPLEAMAAARPVVAVDRAGPLETVRDGETGFLRPATPEAFADALALLANDRPLAGRLGRAGRRHVSAHFSSSVFGDRLEALLTRLVREGPRA